MGLELREAALEDAADQKGSLDEAGGLARLDHSRWVQSAPIGLPRLRSRVDVRPGPVKIPSVPQIPQRLMNSAHVDISPIHEKKNSDRRLPLAGPGAGVERSTKHQ